MKPIFMAGRLVFCSIAAALACVASLPAYAAPQMQPTLPTLPAGGVTLTDKPGVVSWNTLAKVKQIKAKDRILPEFSKDITALGDKDVKLQGFMMPLEPGEKQTHFLISLNPQTCAFCLPAGPEGVVEVKSKTPVKYSLEPVLLSGKMTILKDDPMGLYYRLTDAAPAK